MAWLRLTHRDGIKCLVNTDQVSEIYVCSGAYRPTSAIRMDDGLIAIEETIEEIAAMIADAERAERIERFAACIIHSDNNAISIRFKPDTVWKLAEQYVDARPEIGGK